MADWRGKGTGWEVVHLGITHEAIHRLGPRKKGGGVG